MNIGHSDSSAAMLRLWHPHIRAALKPQILRLDGKSLWPLIALEGLLKVLLFRRLNFSLLCVTKQNANMAAHVDMRIIQPQPFAANAARPPVRIRFASKSNLPVGHGLAFGSAGLRPLGCANSPRVFLKREDHKEWHKWQRLVC